MPYELNFFFPLVFQFLLSYFYCYCCNRVWKSALWFLCSLDSRLYSVWLLFKRYVMTSACEFELLCGGDADYSFSFSFFGETDYLNYFSLPSVRILFFELLWFADFDGAVTNFLSTYKHANFWTSWVLVCFYCNLTMLDFGISFDFGLLDAVLRWIWFLMTCIIL